EAIGQFKDRAVPHARARVGRELAGGLRRSHGRPQSVLAIPGFRVPVAAGDLHRGGRRGRSRGDGLARGPETRLRPTRSAAACEVRIGTISVLNSPRLADNPRVWLYPNVGTPNVSRGRNSWSYPTLSSSPVSNEIGRA